MMQHVLERLTELERRLSNSIQTGTIIEADYSIARVRVKAGALETTWLPWVTNRAANGKTWWAPDVGEQVLLLCPNGSPEIGVVMPAIYQTAHPAPETNRKTAKAVFEDGTTVLHDSENHVLTINVAGSGAKFHLISAGDGEINCTGNLAIKAAGITIERTDAGGQVAVIGPVEQTGGDFTSDGVSVQHHTHTDTPGTGAGTTSEPN